MVKQIIIIAIVILCMSVPISCDQAKTNGLPVGAHVYADLDNGWIKFRLDGECFLYKYRAVFPNKAKMGAITKIDCE